MTSSTPAPHAARYDAMCDEAAARVMAAYSTSFSLATRLLAAPLRRDIRNLYAMVRIADEIVDGAAAEAGHNPGDILDAYEAQVLEAPSVRFHTDPVVHAYAATARRCEFDPEHISAFFDSMRRDVTQKLYSPQDFEAYVYGSAEVIGLLCLSVFVAHEPVGVDKHAALEDGARALGSALQKVNFLRDLADDRSDLGRSYFPQVAKGTLDDATKHRLTTDIRAELDRARAAIPLLPRSARAGVAAAEALFRELNERIDATPAAELARRRVSVPNHTKLIVTARAVREARKDTRHGR